MIEIKDQMNRTIRLKEIPKRIVSLVPSQTELLYDLGLDDSVVGITKFCVHPKIWFEGKKRVGGTKKLNLEQIIILQPDLIIANKEENTQADIEALAELFPVYISDIFSVDDACQMISDIGSITNTIAKSSDIVATVKQDFLNLPKFEGRVLYFIWDNPYMVVGYDTFIGHLLTQLGFENAIEDPSVRYKEINREEILALRADTVLLSSEPYPFSQQHIKEFQAFYKEKIMLVDGEMFSWYGSRMLKMKAYFDDLKTNMC